MTAIETSKPCKVCGIIKPLRDYYHTPNTLDRRMNLCKICSCAKGRVGKIERQARHAEGIEHLRKALELLDVSTR